MSHSSAGVGTSGRLQQCPGVAKRLPRSGSPSVGGRRVECDCNDSDECVNGDRCEDDSLPVHADECDTGSLGSLRNVQCDNGNGENEEDDESSNKNGNNNDARRVVGARPALQEVNIRFQCTRPFSVTKVRDSVGLWRAKDEDGDEEALSFSDTSPLGYGYHQRKRGCLASLSSSNGSNSSCSPLDTGDDGSLGPSELPRDVSATPLLRKQSECKKALAPRTVPLVGMLETQALTPSFFHLNDAQLPHSQMQANSFTHAHVSTDKHGQIGVHHVTEVGLFYPVTPLNAQVSAAGESQTIISDNPLTI